MDNPTCETCRWWGSPPVAGAKAPCRAGLPTVVAVGRAVDTVWPLTYAADFCGEHQPRQPAEAEAPRPRIDPETRRVLEFVLAGMVHIGHCVVPPLVARVASLRARAIRAHLAKLDGGDHG